MDVLDDGGLGCGWCRGGRVRRGTRGGGWRRLGRPIGTGGPVWFRRGGRLRLRGRRGGVGRRGTSLRGWLTGAWGPPSILPTGALGILVPGELVEERVEELQRIDALLEKGFDQMVVVPVVAGGQDVADLLHLLVQASLLDLPMGGDLSPADALAGVALDVLDGEELASRNEG